VSDNFYCNCCAAEVIEEKEITCSCFAIVIYHKSNQLLFNEC